MGTEQPGRPVLPLAGRVVLVTGASRGIGAAIARRAALAGADVAIGYRSRAADAEAVADDVRAQGRRAVTIRADVTRRGEVDAMVQTVAGTLGGLDGLVNNAADLGRTVEFLRLTEAEWDTMLRVGVTGLFHCTQAALPVMLRRGAGSIVNIGSRLADVGAAERVHYATAKAAVGGMTRALARELAPSGIRVNAVAPGAVDTAGTPLPAPDRLAAKLRDTPLGRLTTDHEIADCVVFLLSDAAEPLHGQTLHASGGAYMG